MYKNTSYPGYSSAINSLHHHLLLGTGQIEKEEIRAVVQLVELPEPVTVYEAKFIKDGREYEIEIAADGEVLGIEAEDDEGEDDDDE